MIAIRALLAIALTASLACGGTYDRHGVGLMPVAGTPIEIRYIDGVTPPPGIEDAARAIDEVMSKRFQGWSELADIAIEWLPYGSVVVGPYITTGFVTRGPQTIAVGQPTLPISDDTVSKVARVVGTIRIERALARPLPSKPRCTAIVMDMRRGLTPREVLEGSGGEKPRVDVGGTSLFYEVSWRIVPVCIMGLKAAEIWSREKELREIEDEIKAAYMRLRKRSA